MQAFLSSLYASSRLHLVAAVALSLSFCGVLPAQTPTAPQLLPYTSRLIAGGGTVAIAAGGICPVSGFTATDKYGDGCLATEVEIGNTAVGGSTPGARSAVADANGNVFFTDYQNALVRRVDVSTGIVTAIAGGGTTAAGTSTGALGTAVKLVHPAGIAFAPNGDLYFSDPGNGQVFKIAATNGFITTGGTLSLVAGNSAGTFGYAASNATTTVTLANSYLRAVYGLAFDSLGDLFMTDEFYYTIIALNTNPSGSNTVNNVVLPAGQIWKVAGAVANSPYCVNGTASSSGCTLGVYASGVQANRDMIRALYSVAVDPQGNLYGGEEFYNGIFEVSPAGVLNNYAGIPNNAAKVIKRAPAGTFGIGSDFGVAVDTLSNVYFTDASNGVIWRVDAAGKSQYVVAGGATTVCAAATDTVGDGCPATQSKMGSSGTGNFATTTFPGPGVFGISVDPYGNLFFGDTETNLVREIATGTQFGSVGYLQASTQKVEVHFAANDAPAPVPFTMTSGASIFTIGTQACTANSDGTTDCVVPLTVMPTAVGPFSGTLQATSSQGGVGSFAVSGIAVQSPVTRISVAASTGPTCPGTNVVVTGTPVTLTATIVSSGSPTGTVTFLANGTPVGTPQPVMNGVATLMTSFSTANTYNIAATYNGDSYFQPSTSGNPASVVTSAPGFTATVIPFEQNSVAAGQTGLYSLNLATNVYTGTITMSCSGLPANSSCMFSPTTITATGCSATSTIALSILTQGAPAASSLSGGRGPWSMLTLLLGCGMALVVGLRRRQSTRFRPLWMAAALLFASTGLIACGSGGNSVAVTPAGSYTVMVTATGSNAVTSSFTVPFAVH